MPFHRFRKILFLSAVLLLFSLPFTGEAQTNTARWDDYFSYKNVNHILEINGVIYCSAENGFFTYEPGFGGLEKYSKVNGLNDVGITSFNYSHENDIILIGYERGEMDMLGEDEIHNLLEIPLHQFYTGDKRVNHIFPYQNIAVISGEFGLATFSLEDFEFQETVYFAQGGVYFGVKEAVVLDDIIYAASDKGIYYHALDGFIPNFVAWEKAQGVPEMPFKHIVIFNGNLVAATENQVYRSDGFNWQFMGSYPGIRSLTVNNNTLSITQETRVSNFNSSFVQTESFDFGQELNTGMKIGGITYGGSVFEGLITMTNSIAPDGPYNNKSWNVTTFGERLWIAPGGMINFNKPQDNSDGFSYFNGLKWNHIRSSDMLDAKDITDIEPDPNDPSEYYVSTWNEYNHDDHVLRVGMFRFKENLMLEHYNDDNSEVVFRQRIGGSRFDDQGNLWIGQSYVDPTGDTHMVRRKAGGGWEQKNLNSSLKDAGALKPFTYNGYGFLALPRGGGLKITNMNEVYTIDATASRGNLPSDQITGAAIDNDGTLWIGTILGLRVLYSPIEAVQSEAFQTFPIIIEQNGIPEALLTDIQVNCITVDSANQKWIGTESAGVYYFSESGEETIYHFTSANSPLPSNKVNNISVNKDTGVVYFATDRGVVSFRSDAVEVGDSFGDVYSYPNPVRPGFSGEVTIKGLPRNADVRITDVVGNLIYKTKAAGGVAKWDTKNTKGKPVASGIYLVLMTNRDASETKQTKIAIVR